MVFGRRYRVTEKVGTGGMADVYKAVDETLGRTVAVKVLHPRFASAPDFVDRFRREAQAAANLTHPGIVNIYDWGNDGGTYYIVMEYVHGTDLKSLVRDGGQIEPMKAAEYAEQLCSALAVAHGYDIVHRDIKPQNIVLMPDGRMRVMDFGIARITDGDDLTQTGSVLGTAQYVSPEQAQGRSLGPASDLYSLGIVLYEMVTGRPPFDADSPVAVALKQVNERPVPPRERNPRVPAALDAVIMRALEKDPARRYASADEMRRDLRRVIEGREPTTAEPQMGDTSVMPTVRQQAPVRRADAREQIRPRRRVWPWLAGLAIVLAVGIGTALALGIGASVQVPTLSGMTLEEATASLTGARLEVGEVTEDYSSDVPKGKVMGQTPAAGERVDKGAEVALVISKGEEAVKVPEITGMAESDAFSALREAGFEVGSVQRQYSALFGKGIAITSEPTAGVEVPRGSSITLIVSDGVETKALPNVVGKTAKDAKAALEQAGFKVKQLDEFSDKIKKGTVFAQDPDGGVVAETGSTVTIHVSKGPENIDVPDVTTMSEADAKTKLEGLGFKVLVNQIPSADVGKVVTQDPVAGSTAKPGDTVTIWVGVASP